MFTSYPRQNVHPQPQFRDMDRRGRSREVSQAALARHASEERRRRAEECLKEYLRVTAPPPVPRPISRSVSPLSPPAHSPSLSPHSSSPSATTSASMSPDCYDSSDFTPSLEDQVHVAYALDDIHLAKILLLRLKGIEVTSDDDPRIDAVRDEDFDICFIPAGRLLDEEDEKAVLEAQRKEKEKWEEERRAEKLRACEKIWDDEKRRMKSEKLTMLKKKEEQALAMAELRKREAEKLQQRTGASFKSSRKRFRNGGVDQFPGKGDTQIPFADDPFQYPFMTPSISPRAPKLSLPSASLPNSNCVSFKDVLVSMNGPLFPSRSSHHSPPRSHTKADLLDSLLKVVEWEDGERRRIRGKGVPVRSSRVDSCAACSAASSTSSSTGSRWSFTSQSSGSSVATSLSSASPSSYKPPLSWLKPSSSSIFTASPVSEVPPPTQLRHSCRSRLIFVDPAECPLASPEPKATVNPGRGLLGRLELDLVSIGLGNGETNEFPGATKGKRLVRRVSRSVSSFVDLAKGIQSAYISATVLSITPSNELLSEKDLCKKLNQKLRGEKTARMKLKPTGYRVDPSSISIFAQPDLPTFAPNPEAVLLATPSPIYIPLIPSSSFGAAGIVQAPRTHIPFPLPLQFPPPFSPPRSPLRPRQPPPPGSVLWRMRPVGNPVLLRLRALKNVLWERGVGWEGKGREGGLSAGRERLCRVAVEGRGRSRLGSTWEAAGECVALCG